MELSDVKETFVLTMFWQPCSIRLVIAIRLIMVKEQWDFSFLCQAIEEAETAGDEIEAQRLSVILQRKEDANPVALQDSVVWLILTCWFFVVKLTEKSYEHALYIIWFGDVSEDAVIFAG